MTQIKQHGGQTMGNIIQYATIQETDSLAKLVQKADRDIIDIVFDHEKKNTIKFDKILNLIDMIEKQQNIIDANSAKLAMITHDAKVTRYISLSFAGLFMAFLVSVGLTA